MDKVNIWGNIIKGSDEETMEVYNIKNYECSNKIQMVQLYLMSLEHHYLKFGKDMKTRGLKSNNNNICISNIIHKLPATVFMNLSRL